MTRPGVRFRGLVARLYLFTIAQVLVVAIAVPWLAHIAAGRPPAPREQRAEARYVVDTLFAHRGDPVALRAELERVRTRLDAQVSLFTPEGDLLATSVEPALPAHPPAHHPPRSAIPAFDPGPPPQQTFVLTARDAGGAYGVYRPAAMRFPRRLPDRTWAVLLALVGAAVTSVLLARSFARRLGRLADAASAFGAGDLSARARLEGGDEFAQVGRSFDEMAGRVARLIRGQRELLINVSHELRTPLARMRVALDLAAEGDAATARDSMGEIAEDLNELEQLVRDVLDNARLELSHADSEAVAATLRREPVDAAALAEHAAQRFRTRHPARTLAVSTPDEAPELLGDGALLRRALDNLLDNAAKYSDRETSIALRVRARGHAVELEIEDHGIGIDPTDLARVGTEFFRTDRSRARTTGGVGLGLSLSRRIAEAHGGTLKVESEPGVGTRVVIAIPLPAATDEPAGA